MSELHNFIFTCWALFCLYWLVSAFRTKGNIVSRRSYPGIRLLIIIVFVLLIRIALVHVSGGNLTKSHTNSQALAIIGTVIFLSGLALAIWARIHLADKWGTPMNQKQNTELVTSGPYHFVRHPIYTGILLATLGTAIAISWLWLVVLLMLGAYFIYSATQEERYLTKVFPKAYPSYVKRSKMLLPFLF